MILDRYILRLWATPFLTSLSIVMFVLLLGRALRLLDQSNDVVGIWGVIWQLLTLTLPYFLLLAVPISFFLAIQLVIIELQDRSELDGLRAAGVSYIRVLRSIVWVSVAIWAMLLVDSLFILPKAQIEFANLLDEAYAQKSTPILIPQRFSDEINNVRFYVQGQLDKNNYKGIIIDDERSSVPILYVAEEGKFKLADRQLEIRLGKGYRLEGEAENQRLLSFQEYSVAISVEQGLWKRLVGTEHESLMSAGLLIKLSINGDQKARVELSRRLVLASTIWVLFFLALPLSIGEKRSGNSSRIILGILSLVGIYNLELVLLRYAANGQIMLWMLWLIYFSMFLFVFWLWLRATRDRTPEFLTNGWGKINQLALIIRKAFARRHT